MDKDKQQEAVIKLAEIIPIVKEIGLRDHTEEMVIRKIKRLINRIDNV